MRDTQQAGYKHGAKPSSLIVAAVNVTDVQKWLAVDRNEPGYSILTEEEIVDVHVYIYIYI